MHKVSWLVAMVALLSLAAGTVQAGSIVSTDSGNLGNFTFTNAGIVGNTAIITVSSPSTLATLDTVNGATIPSEVDRVTTPTTLLVTPTGGNLYDLALPPGTIETVGATAGQQAVLGFNLTKGATSATLPDFFNASGFITSLILNNNPNVDFRNFANGLGMINFTFTGTTFTHADSFVSLFVTPGATAIGNGAFSEVAGPVPAPASLLLMSLGLAGTGVGLAIRRRFARLLA